MASVAQSCPPTILHSCAVHILCTCLQLWAVSTYNKAISAWYYQVVNLHNNLATHSATVPRECAKVAQHDQWMAKGIVSTVEHNSVHGSVWQKRKMNDHWTWHRHVHVFCTRAQSNAHPRMTVTLLYGGYWSFSIIGHSKLAMQTPTTTGDPVIGHAIIGPTNVRLTERLFAYSKLCCL